MGKYQNASDALARMINQYRDLEAVSGAVADLGSLDTLHGELTAKVQALTDQKTALQDEVGKAKKKKDKTLGECEQLRADAQAACDTMKHAAEDEAQRLVNKARADALAIVNDANSKAQATIEAMNQKLQSQLDESNALAQQIAAAKTELDATHTQLADATEKLAAAREHITKLLGS